MKTIFKQFSTEKCSRSIQNIDQNFFRPILPILPKLLLESARKEGIIYAGVPCNLTTRSHIANVQLPAVTYKLQQYSLQVAPINEGKDRHRLHRHQRGRTWLEVWRRLNVCGTAYRVKLRRLLAHIGDIDGAVETENYGEGAEWG